MGIFNKKSVKKNVSLTHIKEVVDDLQTKMDDMHKKLDAIIGPQECKINSCPDNKD